MAKQSHATPLRPAGSLAKKLPDTSASTTKFDEVVADRRMPKLRKNDVHVVWDR
jgi:hypothetical protein